jgi:hypothetical protein
MGSRIEGGGVIGGDEPLDGLKGDCHPNMLQRMRNRVDKSMLVRGGFLPSPSKVSFTSKIKTQNTELYTLSPLALNPKTLNPES